MRAIEEGGDLAAAAVATLRGFLEGPEQPAASALDALMALAVDTRATRRARRAAIEALGELPDVRSRLADVLGPDVAPAERPSPESAASDAVWRDALEGRLPDTPAALREAAAIHAAATPPGTLRRLVDTIRDRESAARAGRRRDEWRSVRGAVHQALALQHSRIAMYDVRETLAEAAGPLPPSFLAALHAAGDAASLEAVAAAYARASRDDSRWRHELTSVFRAIAARERVTRRRAVMKRIAVRWPEALRDLSAGG